MSSVNSRDIVDEIIKGHGYYPGDHIRVVKIVEYTNNWGGTAYGLIYQGEDLFRYRETQWVQQPKTIWEYGKEVTHSSFEMGPELEAMLEEARAAEYKRLREAGTPYWCIHKGRGVDHPAAYWKEDGYFREDGIEMQYKHGVMCGDCGGYIQEG